MSWCLVTGLVERAQGGGDLLSSGISSSQPASKFWEAQNRILRWQEPPLAPVLHLSGP